MTDTRLFPTLTEYQIECAKEAGEELSLADGQVIFRENQGIADFYVVLEGKIKVTRHGEGGQEVVLVVHEPGEFTGTTDLLTGEAATATGFALGPTRVVRVPVARFRELLMACPEMRALLLPALTERRTTEFAIDLQQQKLAALGKLSAGLAHELNNPASAALRSAQSLERVLGDLETLCCDLLNRVMSVGSPSGNGGTSDGIALKRICDLASNDGKAHEEMDPLARSDREQELGEWLATMKVPDAWDAAGALVSCGITKEHLLPVARNATAAQTTKLLTWLAKDVEMHTLCRELGQSTTRISELIGAMKSYSYMDQAAAKSPTDVQQGIDTTLTILKHKLKKKDVKVNRRYGALPPVAAFGGELNQVWTNLIDNAIDAAPTGGHIDIHTAQQGDQALIEITDDGPGIPAEIRDRIFEPFFTTKGVGQGTGLGLDTTYRIVRNHHGNIRFESKPGETRFSVWLPIH